MRRRRAAGLPTRCLIIENVPNLLRFLGPEQLRLLKMPFKIHVVSGAFFGCANMRERIVLVAFEEEAHLQNFRPPDAWTAAPVPLGSILKPYTATTGRSLLIKPNSMVERADGTASHVVTPSWPLGARSPTSSYGDPRTPGTLVCLNPKFTGQRTPLTKKQLGELAFGDVRKLHPVELLASFSFKQTEFPVLSGALHDQYSAVCQTVCVNVFEVFTAQALDAMGITEPLRALRERRSHETTHRPGDGYDIVERTSKLGVPYLKFVFRNKQWEPLEEDELSEYERQRHAQIDENQRMRTTLGL